MVVPPRQPGNAKTGRLLVPLAVAIFLTAGFAGCLERPGPPGAYGALDGFKKDASGRKPGDWPDLEGTTITILDNGAFGAFEVTAKQFELLTHVKVNLEDGEDGGTALQKLIDDQQSGTYDIIYGLDNVLLGPAIRAGVLEPYRPALANRIDPNLVFFPQNGSWYATPVDHGYVGINVDAGNPALNSTPITSLAGVRHYADQFVTESPLKSTPGLGFLLATIAAFPEKQGEGSLRYDWHDYWKDLLSGADTDRENDGTVAGCALVVDNWKGAYEQHFSGGYGAVEGLADKAIVTSYTESPAIEQYYYQLDNPGKMRPNLPHNVLESNATFHSIQTMAIAKGTTNALAAQAWIEFSLTTFFQEQAAPDDGVYPVVPSVSVESTWQGVDPAPGSFHDARLSFEYINTNLDRWLAEWTTLSETVTCPV